MGFGFAQHGFAGVKRVKLHAQPFIKQAAGGSESEPLF
jgi:hypothetical protein